MPQVRMLSQDDYYQAVKLTQVVSVDILLCVDSKYLLGKRLNNPAKGYLFNPGGRVFKEESIPDAVKRVFEDEIGPILPRENFRFLGVYEHQYPNNFRDDKFGTHYVSMLYTLNIDSWDFTKYQEIVAGSMKAQHSETAWMTSEEILKSPKVHPYVKDFFRKDASNKVK